MHRQGRIHRDIKPGNIIIEQEGRRKLIDFGLAVHYEAGGRQPIFMTVGYTALELYSETSRQGTTPNIYSVVATLYFCLCGQPPLDMTQRLFRDQVEPIRQRSRDMPPLLARVITKDWP
ncbi:protein kinase [Paenibacillus thiaminolyticus]|uniref:protein kinase domain-containing protein n=1 Tax=Paenibacillus thiaminolyticus TaxID=49283 RepID=UPI0035A60AC8